MHTYLTLLLKKVFVSLWHVQDFTASFLLCAEVLQKGLDTVHTVNSHTGCTRLPQAYTLVHVLKSVL